MEKRTTLDPFDVKRVAERMQLATGALHKMTADVGDAKQVREFSGDRRKNLLAKFVDPALPISKAETMARTNPEYIEELDSLAQQHALAEKTLAEWAAEQASFEAARSLLSYMKNLED